MNKKYPVYQYDGKKMVQIDLMTNKQVIKFNEQKGKYRKIIYFRGVFIVLEKGIITQKIMD